MTPLERAARAAQEADGAYRHGSGQWMKEGGLVGDGHWEDIARAVLTAIREPSEGMENAVAKSIQNTLPLDSRTEPPDVSVMVDYGVSKAAVAAMIDAALAEG